MRAEPGRPSIYLDPDRRPATVSQQAVDALCAHGLDAEQAGFAARVMSLGSVFQSGHADVWLAQQRPDFKLDAPAHTRRSLRTCFLQAMFRGYEHRRPMARRYVVPNVGIQYGRMDSRYYFGLLGLPHSRYARVIDTYRAVSRLMLFDYVIRHPEYSWYGEATQKEHLFSSLGVPRSAWPVRRYDSKQPGVEPTRAYFPDHRPVGVGDWRVVFPFPLASDWAPGRARTPLDEYTKVFGELRRRGIQVTVVLCRKRGSGLPEAVDKSVRPVQDSDRRRFMNQLWLYLFGVATEFDDRRLIQAQGGFGAVRERAQRMSAELAANDTCSGRVPDLVLHECPDLPVESGSA